MTGLGALLLVAAIGLVALLTGRLFVGAFGADLFRRFDPAAAAASLLVGTAELTLLSVSLSGVGFPTRDLVPLIAALQLVPLALAWRRRRLHVLRPRGGRGGVGDARRSDRRDGRARPAAGGPSGRLLLR